MKTRVIINRPFNFMFSLVVIAILLVVVTAFITTQYMTLTGIYVSKQSHTEIVEGYKTIIEQKDAEIEDLRVQNIANVAYLNQQNKLKQENIVSLETQIHQMNTQVDYIANKYYYVFDQLSSVVATNRINYSDLVILENECLKTDVDPHLVLGLMDLESSFNPQAKNTKSSATGLGQFLGSTGKWVYNKFLDYPETYNHSTMATNPEINIKQTVNYLDYLIEYNGGNIEQALISYNGNELGPKYYVAIDAYMRDTVSRGISSRGGRYD